MTEKIQVFIQRIKAYLKQINPRSSVFLTAAIVSLVILLTLLFTILRVGSSQDDSEVAVTSPTPFPTRILTPGKDYVPGQLIVKFKEGVSAATINQTLVKHNATIKRVIPGINNTVITVPVGQEDALRKALSQEGVVKYAELDHIAHALTNDPGFGNQYGLKNSGQSIKGQAGTPNADSRLEEAWNVTKGANIKLAVLDTGIDIKHQDLASKVVLQKFFITASSDDQFGHGTHVAGIAAAITNNTQGIAGACPDCTLMIGKVLDDAGNGPYSVIAEGMIWAADNGAKVINMSLGGYDNDNTLRDAVNYAWGKGSVIVAAAGNNNTTMHFYPGAIDKVVTVAATDNKDKKASFSNYGDWVEVAAAGHNIYSTMPTHTYVGQNSWKTALNYDYISGTSMATPLVSGVAALIWASPHGTSNQAVVDRIYATADKIQGTGSSWTKGRVNAASAVAAGNVTPSQSPTTGPTATQNPTVTANPTTALSPTGPAPTWVCGGSPNSVCTSPTLTPGATDGPNPSIQPSVTPLPGDDCLDPRSGAEKIRDWVQGFLRKINDYVQRVLGNPTDPNRPPPPVPCIVRP